MPKLQPFPALFACLVIGLLLLNTSQFLTSMKHIRQMEEKGVPGHRLHVALMLEGPTYDQGWNSSALESLTELQKQYGFSLEVASNLDPEKITAAAEQYASNGYDLIFGHGVIFSEPFTKVAPFYPETRFVSFNGEAPHSNQTTIRYDMWPAGYLVGKLAAQMTRTRKVGYIIADKPTEYDQLNGFTQAVKDTSGKTKVIVGKVSDFNDIAGATKAAKEMISKGVDVVYTTGDSLNLAVITEAQRANIYAIGYIADQRYIAPNHVIASMIQDVRQCYRTVMSQFTAGKLPSGSVTYGLKEGVNRLSSFGPMVPKEIREEIKRELDKLIQRR
ncbi:MULTISPECIES: BMP family ABC transporter substrate-binding protein [Brevibacillus]|jgi:transcriptional activator of comK gene|uniref:BMP family ABC transporter substrate-binding protein n=1 Tax=Brevibacillus TaxID=55080 RepID=UPI00056987D8|nr:BMP family ABC transporter substrate-binding protein [Brevibacillus borstelensis]MBE5393695.1 BMP family ABC transporter substrate-binding protein [Brevibacillus borstelensis]MCC0563899.1 BMP family ABC transporter substrate-binding protein [Brevibacillus borstelensis]MCM3469988.1 BMP family ABC transporter substrate-binding protein [Brevibacillus borstelensis]MCM3558365.1 BMP family ABC transporter substrate-binding protein [Brevibacillus borstelensis]MCM3591048.1 BMP family ABC transporte